MASPIGPREGKVQELVRKCGQIYQKFLDKSVPHASARWVGFGVFFLIYIMRIVMVGGFYVVTYALSIHLLYWLIQFLTPIDANPDDDDGAVLANKAGDEFKPYVPKVQEFKVWRGMMRLVGICFVLTFFSAFDLPVYWPILLMYFIVLSVTQLSTRIKHMIRFKYVPWDRSKPKFVSKD